MEQTTALPLVNWQNFYVIVGSSAGALTGLLFVIITLIAQTKGAANLREIRAFGSPTMLHFCCALLISAIMAMPLTSLSDFGVCLGLLSTAGLLYSFATIWHARKAAYKPDFEDWIWYTVFPILAHVSLLMSAILLFKNAGLAVRLIAADTLFFLALGIHNAWDTITFLVVSPAQQGELSATTRDENGVQNAPS